MNSVERYAAAGCLVWAVLSLAWQYFRARGKGRTDYSVAAGDPRRGVLYFFTTAMLPSHKETIRKHKLEFGIGLVMHLGAFAAIAKSLLLIALPDSQPVCKLIPGYEGFFQTAIGLFFGLTALCGVILFMRRTISPNLRIMSTPDDYISSFLTTAIIASAALHELGILTPALYLLVSAVVFFYIPVGKLKHVLFFFVARANYGARMGRRGLFQDGKRNANG